MTSQHLRKTRYLVFSLITFFVLGCQADDGLENELEYFEFEGRQWPVPPFTPERVQQFANPDEYAALQKLSIYQPSTNRNGAQAFKHALERSTFFLGNANMVVKTPLLTSSSKAYRVLERGGLGDTPLDPAYRMLSHTGVVWDHDGHLLGYWLERILNSDLETLQTLDRLRYLAINDSLEEQGLDISLLAHHKDLQYLDLATALHSFNATCELENLQEISLSFSIINDEKLNFDCFPELNRLVYSRNTTTSITVSDLPELETAGINGSRLTEFHLDGNTLPALISLNLQQLEVTQKTDIEWPENLVLLNISESRFRGGIPPLPESLTTLTMDSFFDPTLVNKPLPSSLKNLIMKKASDSSLSNLVLPDTLNYLDLEGAQLDDYRFILNASQLESLVLNGSNFEQWEMLPKLSKLRHLSLSNTNFTDDSLQILSEMTQLQSLYVSGTQVSTLLPLEPLQNLNFLVFSETNINDLEQIPYIEGIFGLGFDDQLYYENEHNLPEHIVRMFEDAPSRADCNELNDCEIPIFFRINRSPEISYSKMD